MTDREMLELAATAAGVQLRPALGGAVFTRDIGDDVWQVWNPLTDDGDALRLAVTLDFAVCLEASKNNVRIDGPSPDGLELVNQPIWYDRYAATRRAITRAAAEIGRAMK